MSELDAVDGEELPAFVPDAEKSTAVRLAKHGLAGILNTPTDLLALRSLSRAGVPALFTTNPLQDNYLKALGENYESRLTPVDRLLSTASEKINDYNNETLGIGPPETTGEQIARVVGPAIVPLPSVGSSAANFVLPGFKLAVKPTLTKTLLDAGNLTRVGTNIGLNVGIDQGLRAAINTATDDSTSASMPASTDQSGLPAFQPDIDAGPETVPVSLEQPAQLLSAGTDSSETLLEFVPDAPEFVPDPVVIDKMMEDERVSNITKRILIGVGVAAAGAAIFANKARIDALKRVVPGEHAPFGSTVVKPSTDESVGVWLRGTSVNKNAKLENILSQATDEHGNPALSTKDIRSITSGANIDSAGMAAHAYTTGELGQGTGIKMRVSMRDWGQTRLALPEADRMLFDQQMLAHQEWAIRLRATVDDLATSGDAKATALLRTGTLDEIEKYLDDIKRPPMLIGLRDPATGLLMTNAKVKALAQGLRTSPYKQMANDYGDQMDNVLEYAYKRDVISKSMLDDARRAHTYGGLRLYVPGKQSLYEEPANWMQEVFDKAGITDPSRHKDAMRRPMNWVNRTMEPGQGLEKPLNPHEAGHNYLYRIVEFTNRNNEARNVLFNLNGIDVDGQVARNVRNNDRAVFIGKSDPSNPTSTTELVRRSSTLSDKIKHETGLLAKNPDVEALKAFEGSTTTVRFRGEDYRFYVPDEVLRSVIETQPQLLGMFNQFMRTGKNIVQNWTTGTMLWAPISTAFNYQQIQLNALMRGVAYNPITLVKGLAANASYRSSIAIADLLSRSIARNSGLAKYAPTAAKNLKDRLDARIPKMIMSIVQRESGNLSVPLLPNKLDQTIVDVAKMASPIYGNDMVALKSVVRLWSGIKRVLHEGPLTGLILNGLKDIPNPTPGDVRRIVADSLDIAGDVRRTGTSPFVRGVTAWVPWSSPFVQGVGSFTGSIAHAIKSGRPDRLVYAASAVMAPSASQVIWNAIIGDEYNDHYWNVMTDYQRANNWYFGIPGLPPDKGLLVPLEQHFAVLNSMAIEGVDAVTGASQMQLYAEAKGFAQEADRNGRMIMASIGRYLDIPIPPYIQALFGTVGKQISIHPQHDSDTGEPTWMSIRSIGAPTKFDQSSSTRYADGGFDVATEGVLRAIFGFGGEMLSSIYTSAKQGYASGGFKQGSEYAMSALSDVIGRQSRYAQPLFGSALRSNERDEISEVAKLKAKGVDSLSTMFEKNAPGLHSLSSGLNTLTDAQRVTDDPVYAVVVNYLEGILTDKSQYEEEYREKQLILSELRSGGRYGKPGEEKRPVTYEERGKLAEEVSLDIRGLSARFISSMNDFERQINEDIRKQFGRDIGFEIENYKPRPPLGTGVMLPAPRSP